MSPRSQIVAIALACPHLIEWHDGRPYWKGAWSSVGEGNEWCAEFNPHTDLNAMHKAEQAVLNGHADLWHVYLDRELPDVCEHADNPFECATAAQRAEALLRTLNLWDDAK